MIRGQPGGAVGMELCQVEAASGAGDDVGHGVETVEHAGFEHCVAADTVIDFFLQVDDLPEVIGGKTGTRDGGGVGMEVDAVVRAPAEVVKAGAPFFQVMSAVNILILGDEVQGARAAVVGEGGVPVDVLRGGCCGFNYRRIQPAAE